MRAQIRNWIALSMLLGASFRPQIVFAGMPSISLTEVASLRIANISFFVVGLLLSAAAIQGLWNWLRRDFVKLPRLTYSKACGIVVLWGLLFVVVLTMISGARELMTPGAWEKQGWSHRLKNQSGDPIVEQAMQKQREAERRQLERLADLLAVYAANHEGSYPASDTAAEIPPARWLIPPRGELRFRYVPGLKTSDAATPLAYTPLSEGKPIPVLLASGEITELDFDEIARRVQGLQP